MIQIILLHPELPPHPPSLKQNPLPPHPPQQRSRSIIQIQLLLLSPHEHPPPQFVAAKSLIYNSSWNNVFTQSSYEVQHVIVTA